MTLAEVSGMVPCHVPFTLEGAKHLAASTSFVEYGTSPVPMLHFCLSIQILMHVLFAWPLAGIVIQAYGPLGSPTRYNVESTDPVVLEDPTIKEIAARKGTTPAQVRTDFFCLHNCNHGSSKQYI